MADELGWAVQMAAAPLHAVVPLTTETPRPHEVFGKWV